MKPAYLFHTSIATRLCFAACLVVALLFAQWMGLRHQIQHADKISSQHVKIKVGQFSSFEKSDAASDTTTYAGDKSHSCTLFDGMALADSAPTLPFIPLLQTSVHVLALWAAHASWDAPFLRLFSSRAPPTA